MLNDRQAQEAIQRQLGARVPRATASGYVTDFTDNLVEGVHPSQFANDLEAGDGSELRTKFRAAHSSSALAVNTFAWFRHPDRLSVLSLLGTAGATSLRFERQCPIFRGGRPPNLDVWVEREHETVAIESKLTEHLVAKRPHFSSAYDRLEPPKLAEECWWEVYGRAKEAGPGYLDTAQLVKHYFGLRKLQQTRASGKPLRLLYLFWEPLEWQSVRACVLHREEVAALTRSVEPSSVRFYWLTYPQLWDAWANNPALQRHVETLRSRYEVCGL